MAAQAIYRRWRSRTFAELIGQEHVTQTLLNSLRAGRIGHAYLFTGPRGTGKTSAARIFAKAVNCLDPQNGEPCNHCSICVSINEGRALDLIEIDAASNRGIMPASSSSSLLAGASVVSFAVLQLRRRSKARVDSISAEIDGLAGVPTVTRPVPVFDRSVGSVSVGASAVLPGGVNGFANIERLLGRDNFRSTRLTVGVRIEF